MLTSYGGTAISYYYDTETGFYYLQSRYYDPTVGRFLNADHPELIGANGGVQGYNLFAYCNNNQVMFCDDLGFAIRPTTVIICDGGSREPPYKYSNDKSVIILFCEAVEAEFTEMGNRFAEASTNVAKDLQNFDFSNTDEQKVIEANYFSSYNGVPVFKIPDNPWIDRSFSYYSIFLTSDANADTVRHEYGHSLQFMEMGPTDYFWCIGVPSMAKWGDGLYYNRQQEVLADVYGDVQGRTHTQEQIDAAYNYIEDYNRRGIRAWENFFQ